MEDKGLHLTEADVLRLKAEILDAPHYVYCEFADHVRTGMNRMTRFGIQKREAERKRLIAEAPACNCWKSRVQKILERG